MIRILSYILVFGLLGCSRADGYREYVPLIWDGNAIVESPEIMDEGLLKDVEHVLRYYRINYKTQGEVILLDGSLHKEMQWNITTKARDTEWLSDHPIK